MSFGRMGGGGGRGGASIYSQWANFPRDPNFFPVTAWLQNPLGTRVSGFNNDAEAIADCGVNILLGVDDAGVAWPSAFGEDSGQMAAIKAAGLYVIPWGQTLGLDTTSNVTRNSVASFIALDIASGGTPRLIGYNDGDEPACGAPINEIPSRAAAITAYDNTRPYFCNLLPGAFLTPAFAECRAATIAALQATGVGSFDLYAMTNPYNAATTSDYLSVPQDLLYTKGLSMQTMRSQARVGQPLWTFIAGGNDALGQAGEANTFTGAVENGNTTLTIVGSAPRFSAAWLGLTVTSAAGHTSGGRTIEEILSPTTSRMSSAATGTKADDTITVTGGDLNHCVADGNICVARGNRWRATPAEVAAEVWISIINGANGIQWFAHDSSNIAYSFGGGGSAGALEAAANLKYINGILRSLAAMLNSVTIGICSMDSMDPVTGTGTPTVASSCSNGILTMATSDVAVPGAALVKSFNGKTYLLAQPSRRGSASMTFTLTGKAGQTATTIYDTNLQYDSAHHAVGDTFVLNGSAQFSDTFGAHSNHYQTKIYRIQ